MSDHRETSHKPRNNKTIFINLLFLRNLICLILGLFDESEIVCKK